MEELFRQAMLFDFYSPMLTPRQQEICRMHLQEDLSLGEIAEELGISRQAVSDAVKHGISTMEKAEEQLHTVERFLRIRNEIDTLERLTDEQASGEEIKKQIQVLRSAVALEDTGVLNGI